MLDSGNLNRISDLQLMLPSVDFEGTTLKEKQVSQNPPTPIVGDLYPLCDLPAGKVVSTFSSHMNEPNIA